MSTFSNQYNDHPFFASLSTFKEKMAACNDLDNLDRSILERLARVNKIIAWVDSYLLMLRRG